MGGGSHWIGGSGGVGPGIIGLEVGVIEQVLGIVGVGGWVG